MHTLNYCKNAFFHVWITGVDSDSLIWLDFQSRYWGIKATSSLGRVLQYSYGKVRKHSVIFSPVFKITIFRISQIKYRLFNCRPRDDLDMQLPDIFGNSVPIGNFKNGTNTIWTSLKDIQFSKVIGQLLKNCACQAHFQFELKLTIILFILQLETSPSRFK